MKRRKIPFGRAVRISWHDSRSLGGWQYNSKKPREVAKIVTMGYVVQSNEEGLTLSSSISTDGNSLDDIVVPWGCIVHLENLPPDWNR